MPMSSPIPHLKQVENFIAQQQGGGDGIMRTAGSDGSCSQTTPASLNVQVTAFKGFASGRLVELIATTTTDSVTVPSGGSPGDLRRIDLLQYTWGAAGLNIKEGVEGAGPSAPSLDADSIAIAHIYCRNGMTVVKTADDSSNGYIVDQRSFV